ncbi:TetR/AcrR family transcriptional regulator [Companilactobacillus allii]|uniref:HTH tetR-type domain-containing protein n=1 Tax=Companilactobacillus allii TaxID=1847728 RepID=A0A1P8Q4P6_9LACO|nr:TetR/AcrR family transcriptional regulator [Companilactobacillus allii]APX72832.1 hypothetical protein BTM29_09845 [Companilactobacillus allii]USQ67619.1 TetR/AcrR family transcriptional regulator [Companilactobacillus allii]
MSNDIVFKDLNDWIENSDMPNGKRKVLQAAIKLFSIQGFNGTSTSEIAKESGMSQATIFKYFKSKDDLLLAIITPIIERIIPTYGENFFNEFSTSSTSLKEMIHFAIFDRYSFMVNNKDAILILLSEVLVNPKVKDMIVSSLLVKINKFINIAWTSIKNTGEIRDDIDFIAFVRLAMGQLAFYFLQTQKFSNLNDKEQIEKDLDNIVQMVFRAVKK